MKSNSTFLERYSLPLYLILTPLISLALPLFMPLPAEVTPLLIAFIPALLALALTAMTRGRNGVSELMRKLFIWRVGVRWYAIVVALVLVLRLTISVIALLLGWIPAVQFSLWSLPEFILIGIFILIGAASEELGWRGYALPRLLESHSALYSALLIGVIWGTIHLGLTLPGQMNASTPWLANILSIIGFSVILTWLYIQTQGSLVIPILFHAGQNFLVFLNGGISLTQQLWLLAVVAIAIGFLLTLRFGVNLQRGPGEKPIIADAG